MDGRKIYVKLMEWKTPFHDRSDVEMLEYK